MVTANRHGTGWEKLGEDITLHTGSGDTVAASATSIGGVKVSGGADRVILKMEYTKGTEATGIQIYVVFPRTFADSTLYKDGMYTDIGGGAQLYDAPYVFQYNATATTDLPIDLKGRLYFNVYQIAVGALGLTPGTIKMYAQLLGK